MNHSQLSIDATQWKRIGRRRFTVLAVLLTANLSLIALGVNSHLSRASVATAALSRIDGANDGQSRAAVSESSSETIHQETASVREQPASPLPKEDVAPDTTSPVETAAVPQSQMAQDKAEPADENQSALPIATAPPANDDINASQQAGADSSKPSPSAPIAADEFEPRAVEETSPSLTIINPPATRGMIHYAIDGSVQTLSPGEYHRLEAGEERRIEFHQGDDLGYTQRVLSTGVFIFRVGESGWELVQLADGAGRRLLRACRLIDVKE